jgi:hypothetical protein
MTLSERIMLFITRADKEGGNTNQRIIDAEGIRIGDLVLDYREGIMSMWWGLGWTDQNLTKEDMKWLIDALIMCHERD